MTCLEEFDPSVKESSAWALGYIARHTKELAQTVVDAGAVPLLVLCYQGRRRITERGHAFWQLRMLVNGLRAFNSRSDTGILF